jgi:glycine/D-amino acid oxidase-like deaminating enzyme
VWTVGVPPLGIPPLNGTIDADVCVVGLGGTIDADVCVVGLGGSGLSCIGELHRLGARVVGIDAATVGGGAAGRNGGFLLAGIAAFHHEASDSHGRERAVRAWRLTLDELERIAAETPDAVRRTGTLRIAVDDEELADCERQLEVMRQDRLPVESYEGWEGRGLLFPRDGSFQPLLRCRQLATRAVERGARLFEHTRALDISADGVSTAAGRVRAPITIVAVDGGLERVFPELAGRVRTVRLQMIGTAPATDVHYERPVYSRYGLDYWQQLADGRIALGGFRDIGGDAEWTHDAQPSEAVQRALERCLRERVRTSAPITHRWAASVSYTPDGLPVVEQVRPGVWATGAYNGTGNVVGALCGRAVAQLAVSGSTELLL